MQEEFKDPVLLNLEESHVILPSLRHKENASSIQVLVKVILFHSILFPIGKGCMCE